MDSLLRFIRTNKVPLGIIACLTAISVLLTFLIQQGALGGHQRSTQVSANSNISQEQSNTPAPSASASVSTEPPWQPSMEDFANATLRLPQACEAYMAGSNVGLLSAVGTPITLSQGTLTGGATGTASVTIRDVIPLPAPAEVPGGNAALVTMVCDGGGNHAYPAIGIYSKNYELLGSVEPYFTDNEALDPAQILSGNANRYNYTDIATTSTGFTMTVKGLELSGANSVIQTASVHLEVTWESGGFHVTDAVYSTHDGRTFRSPNMDELHAFYQGVRDGNQAIADQYAPGRLDISRPDIIREDNRPNVYSERAMHMPEGGTLPGCFLLTSSLQGQAGGTKWYIPSANNAEAGDFACPVDFTGTQDPTGRTWQPMEQDHGGIRPWAWMIVRTNDEGTPTVVGLDRYFG